MFGFGTKYFGNIEKQNITVLPDKRLQFQYA